MIRRLGVIAWILLQSSLRGIASGRVTSAVAVVTIAVVLVLLGSFGLLLSNMSGLLERFGEQLQVTAYLDESLSSDAARKLAARIQTAPGVEQATLVTREEALERFRKMTGGAALLDGLDENPLPASIDIRLAPASRTPEGLAILTESLDGLPGIAELAHGQEWIEGYARAVALVQGAGTVLGVVLVLAALLIVANTIRLGVYARKSEIDILSLVGASRTFVRLPFLLEGTFQGAVGGALALLLLFGGFELLAPQIRFGLELLIGRAEPVFLGTGDMLRILAGGSGLGLLGSIVALVGWRS